MQNLRTMSGGLRLQDRHSGVLASSDLLACVPRRVASALSSSDDVRALALPVEIAPVDISQSRHERCHRDGGHQWLRALIYEMFNDKRPSALG